LVERVYGNKIDYYIIFGGGREGADGLL